MDKDKRETYVVVSAMITKAVLTLAGLVAFFIVFNKLLTCDTIQDRLIFGTFDTLIGGTIFVVYKHYFPVHQIRKKKATDDQGNL